MFPRSLAPCFLLFSVQPRQVCVPFNGLNMASDVLRHFAIIALRPDAHPVAVLTGKLNHTRSRIAAQQLRLQLKGVALFMKSANLYTPASAGADRFGRFLDVHANQYQSGAINAGGFG